jgi:hypothetical protein
MKRLTSLIWSVNALLGASILAYAAVTFLGAKPDLLAEARRIGQAQPPVGAAAPYVCQIEPMRRVGVFELKEPTAGAAAASLSQFILVRLALSDVIRVDLVEKEDHQRWLSVGEDLHEKLGRIELRKDIGPLKGWKLKSIQRGKAAVFSNGQRDETLPVVAMAGAPGVPPGLAELQGTAYNPTAYPLTKATASTNTYQNWQVDANEANWVLANQDTVLNQVTFAPAGDGLKIESVQANSVWQTRGFQEGDIIKSVGQVPVRSAADVQKVRDQFQGKGPILVNVLLDRGGQTFMLRFQIMPPADPKKP